MKNPNFNISFLAKDMITGKKYEVKEIRFDILKVIVNAGESMKVFDFDKCRLLSFTRIYDSNKNKIFDNDRVAVTKNDNTKIHGTTIFQKGKWGVKNFKENLFIPFDEAVKIEII